MRYLLAVIAFAAPSLSYAHQVATTKLQICGFDSASFATFDVVDEGTCSALISVTSSDPSVATVTPEVISAVATTFTVQAHKVGKANILGKWAGEGEHCTGVGDFTVEVTVLDRTHPFCQGYGQLSFEFRPFSGSKTGQYITSTNQRGANVFITHTGYDCECSKVIIVQTIKIGDGEWENDVDRSATGVDTPFYNYDPATGEGIPGKDLGAPGDCTGGSSATLQDNPLQTSTPARWETCAVCCDDGRILACYSWSYDPSIDRGTVIDGVKQYGMYVDDGPIDDMSPGSKKAVGDAISAYVNNHKEAADDPCLTHLQATFGASTASNPPPAPPGTSGGGGGCSVAETTTAGSAVVFLLLVAAWFRRWSARR